MLGANPLDLKPLRLGLLSLRLLRLQLPRVELRRGSGDGGGDGGGLGLLSMSLWDLKPLGLDLPSLKPPRLKQLGGRFLSLKLLSLEQPE